MVEGFDADTVIYSVGGGKEGVFTFHNTWESASSVVPLVDSLPSSHPKFSVRLAYNILVTPMVQWFGHLACVLFP